MGLKRAQRLGEVGGRGGGKDSAPRIGTPIPFRDLLMSIARRGEFYGCRGGWTRQKKQYYSPYGSDEQNDESTMIILTPAAPVSTDDVSAAKVTGE
jgi:hypothetical protein